MRVELIIAQYGIHVNFYNQVGFNKPVINRRAFIWAFQRWGSLFK